MIGTLIRLTKRARLPVVGATAALVLTAIAAVLVLAADMTKIIDADTKFHRVYVVGSAKPVAGPTPGIMVESAEEDGARQRWKNDLRDELAREGNSTAGGITREVIKGDEEDLETALEDVEAAAGSGDEVTLVFAGHGGTSGAFRMKGVKDDPNNPRVYLTKAELAGLVQSSGLGARLADQGGDLTLIVIADSCYGSSLVDDLTESDRVRTIGAHEEINRPVYPPPPEDSGVDFVYEASLTEAIHNLVEADHGNTVSGEQLEDDLESEYPFLDLSPPGKTVGQVMDGDSSCDACPDECPTLSAEPDGDGFIGIAGERFGANASVTIKQVAPDATEYVLGSTGTDSAGLFIAQLPVGADAPGVTYLIQATDDQGFTDGEFVVVSDAPAVGGIAEISPDQPLPLDSPLSAPARGTAAALLGTAVLTLGLLIGVSWHARRRTG